MNIKLLQDRLINNWPAKAICFVLAVLIYFFHQMALLDKKDFIIPLEIKTDGSMMPVSGFERYKAVRITVRTKSDLIGVFSEKDFSAVVDLSHYQQEGSYSIPVVIDFDPKLLLVEPLEIVCKPDYITLEIEKKTVKTVPLKIEVSGTPAYGYKVTSVLCNPSAVTIEGPESVVSGIKNLYLPGISLEGVSSNVSKNLKVINSNKYIKIIDDDFSNVTANVVREEKVKEVSGLNVEYDNLLDTFNIISGKVVVSATIEGGLVDIEKFNASSARAYIDCGFIVEEGTYEVPVHVKVPKNLIVDSISVPVITVTVLRKDEENAENELEYDDNLEKASLESANQEP